MPIKVNALVSILLLCASNIVISADKFGMYDDSEWGVAISHNSSGFAQGHCSEGFILEIPKGGGTINLDIHLKFIGTNEKVIYKGRIQTELTGSTAGRATKEYIESENLCFDIKEVIIIKATGIVNKKRRDLIEEGKIYQSGFIPHPIRVDKNG